MQNCLAKGRSVQAGPSLGPFALVSVARSVPRTQFGTMAVSDERHTDRIDVTTGYKTHRSMPQRAAARTSTSAGVAVPVCTLNPSARNLPTR